MTEINEINQYEKQANDFLSLTNTEFKAEFIKNDLYFPEDTQKRDIYEITLKRGSREYKFKFGYSIAHSGKWIFYTNEGIKLFNSEEEGRKATMVYNKVVRAGKRDYFLNKEFKEPSAYDVLSCLNKSEVGDFEDFCSNYGYDTDSRKAEKTYLALLEEWKNLKMLYSDEELNLLQEIQ
jgi:hypothetical protein